MTKAADLRRAVCPVSIRDRNLDDLQVLPGRPGDEVKVAERIEVAEVVSGGGDLLVLAAQEDLGPAQPHTNLGSVLAITGRLDEAVDEFNRALDIDPDLADARLYLAVAERDRVGE